MKIFPTSLGGKLTIVNAIGIVLCLLAGVLLGPLEMVVLPVFFVLAFPFGIYSLIPSLDGPSYADIVSCVVLGANSFVWGYGFAAILTWWNPSLQTKPEEPIRVDEPLTKMEVVKDDGNPYASPRGPR